MGYRIARGLRHAALAGACAGCAPSEPPLDELLAQDHDAAYDLVERGAATVQVDSIQELQAAIGLEHTVIELATTSTDPGGAYVVPACATREQEGVDPSCGQMTLGTGSALLGELVPELDGSEPTGNVLRAGPLIDCSAATNPFKEWDPHDGNGWQLACLAMSAGIVWGVEIDNGSVTPQDPGQGSHRNGIFVKRSDGPSLVGRTKLTDVRRGVLQGADTQLTVTEVIVERTELAGVNSVNADFESGGNPKALDGAQLEMDMSSTWFGGIGRFAVLLDWGVGGDGLDSTGTYRHVVVDSTSRNSFTIESHAALDRTPLTNARARAEISDSRLEASAVGLHFLWDGTGAKHEGNEVIADVHDVTFANASGAPVTANYVAKDTCTMTVGMRNTAYMGASPGRVTATCSLSSNNGGCPDPQWRLAGTREEFLDANDNFDLSALTDENFTGMPYPP